MPLVMGGAILVAFIVILIVSQYYSQVGIQDAALDRIRLQGKGMASSVSYFLSEREHDLDTLAQNQVLGLSLLKANETVDSSALEPVRDILNRVKDKKKIEGEPIYSSLDILNSRNRSILTGEVSEKVLPGNNPDATVMLSAGDIETQVIVRSLVFYNGTSIGQVEGRIPAAVIFGPLLKKENPGNGRILIRSDHGMVASEGLTQQFLDSLTSDSTVNLGNDPVQLNFQNDNSNTEAWIATENPIHGMPLSLVFIVPESDVYGAVSSETLFLVLVALALGLILGLVWLMREYNRQGTVQCRQALVEKEEILVQEIEDHNQSITALKESEERAQITFEMVSDAMFLIDSETGDILEANETATRLYGYTHEEFLRMQVRDLSTEPEATEQALSSRTKHIDMRYHRKKDGTRFPVEILARYFTWRGREVHASTVRDLTEQIQARETIRAQKEFLKDIIDTIPHHIWVKDAEGRLVLANRHFCQLFKRPLDQLVGKAPSDYVPDASVAAFMHNDDMSLVKGEKQRIEREDLLEDLDGNRRWGRIVKLPVFTYENELQYIVCIGTDISKRKRAELALQESEIRHRNLYNNALVGLYRTNLSDGRILDCNRRFAEIFGYSDLGHFKLEYVFSKKYVDPDVRNRLINLLKIEGQVDGYEAAMYHRDGSTIWLRYTAKANVHDGYMEGFAIDITAQKKAEDERLRLAAAVEQAGEGIFITDVAGNIQYINPAFERITGYSRIEVIGSNPRFLKSGKQDEAYYREMWSSILQGKTWKGRLTNRKKDGSFYEEESTISPVRNEEGRIIHFVSVKRDVSREAALEDQLRQAQKMEAIGQLAGGVAHDFNNLLQAILGHTQLAVADKKKGPSLEENLSEILQAAERASKLTQQLLAFSRRQILQPKIIDLNQLLQNLMKMFGRLLGEHIHIEVQAGSELGKIKADPGQVEQVLLNLALNARDAMPEGGHLTFQTRNISIGQEFCFSHPWARCGEFVLLSVTDTGKGIDSEHREHIFEPFFTTKEVGKGTGLGLATVYGIVKQHDGFLQLSSEVGKGTTFRIYLPMTQEEVVKEEPVEIGLLNGGHETILVAEDDMMVRKLVLRVLERHGYRVRVAVDGAEAINLFEKHQDEIDLVLLDVVMPKINGKAVYDAIRKKSPTIPVLFCSGYTQHILDPALVPKSEYQMIQKPYRPAELLDTIRQILDEKKKETVSAVSSSNH